MLIVAVLLLWTVGRGAMLSVAAAGPGMETAEALPGLPRGSARRARRAEPPGAARMPSGARPEAQAREPARHRRPPLRTAAVAGGGLDRPVRGVWPAGFGDRGTARSAAPPPAEAARTVDADTPVRACTAAGGIVLPARPAVRSPWSGSAWAYLRPEGRAAGRFDLARLGGSQIGVRVARRLDRAGRVSGFVRASSSGAIGDGVEAAAGLTLRPALSIPVALNVERREQVAGSGGRSAFAVYATGGVSAVRLGAGLTLDGYAAAGVVGRSRRDLFSEGSAVVTRPMVTIGAVDVEVGGGAWGAAQPGVERLDVGPRLSARLPLGSVRPRVALDWRQRVAGNAGPRSGLALTIADDF